MKRIVKNKDNDEKPYKLLYDYRIRDLLAKHCCEFTDDDIGDIELSDSQHRLLSYQCCTHWLISYLPLSVIIDIIDDDEDIEHWAYCVHDKDIDSNGEPKKVHTHLLLVNSSRTYLSVSAYKFHTTNIKAITTQNLSNRWNYLIHDTDKCRRENKYIYDKAERISDNEQYFLSRCFNNDNTNVALAMYDDFVHDLPLRLMIEKYGFSFLCNFKNLNSINSFYHNNGLCKFSRQPLLDGRIGFFDKATGNLVYAMYEEDLKDGGKTK